MPRVTVVIPNWNGLVHLPECLESLDRQTFQDFELIVVDNASTDDSVSWLEGNTPRARVVRRDVNGGVPACINSGIRAATGEFIVVLMNDTSADPGWLEALLQAVDDTGYDSAASRLVFYDSPDTINAAGDVYDMRLLHGHQRGRGRPASEFLVPVRVLGACGGAALYRRSYFDDIGLFDEDFFMVHEDTDLNLRALIAGKRCVYAPDAIVRHKDSATVREVSGLQAYSVRNQYRVVGKNVPLVLLPLAALAWAYGTFRRSVPLRPSKWGRIPGLLRQLPECLAVQWEGLRLGWRSRPDVWSRRRVPTIEIASWFLRGVRPL